MDYYQKDARRAYSRRSTTSVAVQSLRFACCKTVSLLRHRFSVMSGSRPLCTTTPGSSSKGPASKPLCDAMAVDRNTQKWCVLVQVLERHPPKDSRDDGNRNIIRFRNYVVTDMKGTKVGIATYASNIALFDDTLLPYKRYYISNAGVRHCGEEYRVGPYMYSWTLYRSTPVDPYEEDTIPRFPCTFEVTKFSDFYSHADRLDQITVTPFVVQAFGEIQHNPHLVSRDYILISDEKLPVIFRVWNNPIEQHNIELWETLPEPVLIVARNVRVTTYHGLSLTTKYNTYIMQDPPLIDENEWTSWYKENHPHVTDMVAKRVYYDVSRMFRPPIPNEIIPIETVRTTMDNIKTAWIHGLIDMLPVQGRLWSTCCKYCNRTYTAGDNSNVYCKTCREWAPIQLRSYIGVRIGDDSGTMDIILSSPELDRLIPFTTADIQAADDNGHPLHDEIEEIIGNKALWCFIKYFDTEVKGNTVRRHMALKLYTEDEMPHIAVLDDPIRPLTATSASPTPPHISTEVMAIIGSPTENKVATMHTSSDPPPTANISTPAIRSSCSVKETRDTSINTSGTKRSLPFNLANIKKEKGENEEAARLRTTLKTPITDPEKENSGKKLKEKVKLS